MPKLQLTTPNDREVRISRAFSAPRHLVWDCHTKPELVRRWMLGPPGWTMPVCEIDLRVGGKYRYVLKGPEGMEMGFGGTYDDVAKPERIVTRELFDQDWTGGETLNTLVLTEAGGVTTVAQTILYSSKEARDGALKTPMADGMEAGYGVMDALLETLKAGKA
jgi:uncharacterized protein YndB with AHSA1/START domain